MAAKCKRECEDLDVSQVESPSTDINIHGVVTQLSPVKVSKKNENVRYFDGKVSDGKKSMRVVSFDPVLRHQTDEARLNKSPIAIVNCQVKEKTEFNFGNSSAFEILATNRFKVEASRHNFDLSQDLEITDQDEAPLAISIMEVDDISTGQHVCVSAKVVQLDTPIPVHNKSGQLLHKQECILADESAKIRMVLWETDIDRLIINKSYKLNKVTVRIYNDVKYLSVSTYTTITPIDDIGAVAESLGDTKLIPDHGNRLLDGSIVAVISVNAY